MQQGKKNPVESAKMLFWSFKMQKDQSFSNDLKTEVKYPALAVRRKVSKNHTTS